LIRDVGRRLSALNYLCGDMANTDTRSVDVRLATGYIFTTSDSHVT